jgi:hypothetical protein
MESGIESGMESGGQGGESVREGEREKAKYRLSAYLHPLGVREGLCRGRHPPHLDAREAVAQVLPDLVVSLHAVLDRVVLRIAGVLLKFCQESPEKGRKKGGKGGKRRKRKETEGKEEKDHSSSVRMGTYTRFSLR